MKTLTVSLLRILTAMGWGIGLALLSSSPAKAFELRTSSRDSAPFFIVKDGKASGICPDIYAALERIAPDLRIRGSEKVLSLSLNERALESGTEALNCGLGQSARRDNFLRYTQQIKTSHMVVAVRADDPIDNLRDLEHLKLLSKDDPVIVRRGTVFADRLKQLGVVVDDSSGDNADNLRKLVFKRGRFYYNIDYLMATQLRDPMFDQKIRVLPHAFEPQPMYLAVSKKVDPAVDARIVAAFKVLRTRGELAEIFKKYGMSPDP